MRILGPYTRKDGRQHVIVKESLTDKWRTVSYPKYLVEQRLGRKLDPDQETIDHLDGNWMNNDPSNLRIIPRSQHASEDVRRVKLVATKCIACGAELTRRAADTRARAKRHKAGPFCKPCAGRYGTDIKKGKDKLSPQKAVQPEYYKVKEGSVVELA